MLLDGKSSGLSIEKVFGLYQVNLIVLYLPVDSPPISVPRDFYACMQEWQIWNEIFQEFFHHLLQLSLCKV